MVLSVGGVNPAAIAAANAARQAEARRAAQRSAANNQSTLNKLLVGPTLQPSGGKNYVPSTGNIINDLKQSIQNPNQPAPGTFTPPTAPSPGLSQFTNNSGGSLPVGGSYKHFNDPRPVYRPMLRPGELYDPGHLCEITSGPYTPSRNGQDKWGFRMWIPPDAVSVGMGGSQQPLTQAGQDTGTAIQVSVGSLTVRFLLNRMEEVILKRQAPADRYHYVMNTRDFVNLGTLYDLEFLYRVCNGNPRDYPYFPSNTANRQFLEATTCQIRLGGGSEAHRTHMYQGYPNSFDIQHLSLTKNMVPIVSECTLSFVLTAPGLSATDLQNVTNAGLGGGDQTSAATKP